MQLNNQELNFIYKCIENIQIQGRDAKFTHNLLLKVGAEINKANQELQEQEKKKFLEMYGEKSTKKSTRTSKD